MAVVFKGKEKPTQETKPVEVKQYTGDPYALFLMSEMTGTKVSDMKII